jgi:hypothetical protein
MCGGTLRVMARIAPEGGDATPLSTKTPFFYFLKPFLFCVLFFVVVFFSCFLQKFGTKGRLARSQAGTQSEPINIRSA